MKKRNRTPEGSNGWERSKTIPGQSLVPAELLERHLAGTLPEIDHESMYEYHYDENGEQIAEPMPIDYIELETLAAAYRAKQREAAIEFRKQEAKELRDRIIAEHMESLKKQSPPDGSDKPGSDKPVEGQPI